MKYIKSVMKNNAFTVNLTARHNNENIEIFDVTLDTGCTHSHIASNSLYIYLSEEDRLIAKKEALLNNKSSLGFGVSDDKDVAEPTTIEEKIQHKNVKVYEKFYGIKLNNINIGDRVLGVSYNNDNVNLIGMSIMKDWDIHIGKDKDGKTVFLGCPRSCINDEYILELERTFGIGTVINSTIVRKRGQQ